MSPEIFSCRGTKACNGFTLIEILLAVMISGILMITLFSAFKSFTISSEALKCRMAESEKIRHSLRSLVRDVQGVYIAFLPRYSKSDSEADPFGFYCDQRDVNGRLFSRLSFVSRAHISFDGTEKSGLARITYYVRAEKDNTFSLCRSDRLLPFNDSATLCDPVVCKDIKGFKVKLVDTEKNQFTRWDSDSREFGYAVPCSMTITLLLN
ncbi:MAG: type II secretion system protein, partial [Desulfobacteraceae bacterium]